MDGLGITFARAWAAKAKASRPQQTSSPQQISSPQQPISSPPLLDVPQAREARPRSSTQSSGDSYMEKRLSEFHDWKQKITKDFSSRKLAKPTIKEESPPLPSTKPHAVEKSSSNLSQRLLKHQLTPLQIPPQTPPQQSVPQQSPTQKSPTQKSPAQNSSSQQSPSQQSPSQQSPSQQSPSQQSPSQQSPSQQSPSQQSPPQLSVPKQRPPHQSPPQKISQPQTPGQEGSPSTQAHSYNHKAPPAVREKAHVLALRARALPKPDLRAHPAFRSQHVRVRKKTHMAKTDSVKCWRPTYEHRDDTLWECCEHMDVAGICEDCGYVLCTACGSRCRGEEWCVIKGCVRCQTKLGVNICTPHLRELRARPTERFYGHLVEPSALFLIEKL
ncbi:hypothetical protein SLS54_006914 [Diplodia seriata]